MYTGPLTDPHAGIYQIRRVNLDNGVVETVTGGEVDDIRFPQRYQQFLDRYRAGSGGAARPVISPDGTKVSGRVQPSGMCSRVVMTQLAFVRRRLFESALVIK